MNDALGGDSLGIFDERNLPRKLAPASFSHLLRKPYWGYNVTCCSRPRA
jgi:hypothetical protein